MIAKKLAIQDVTIAHLLERRGAGRHCASVAERLWNSVEKSNGCWDWTGHVDTPGYGVIHIYGCGPDIRVTRAVWMLAFGKIPAGLFVCHHCDNPRCVRPDHLYLGTPKENSQDMVRRGRLNVLKHLPRAREVSIAKRLAATACKYGHPYTAETVVILRDGSRGCRTCNRLREKARYHRVKAHYRVTGLDRANGADRSVLTRVVKLGDRKVQR